MKKSSLPVFNKMTTYLLAQCFFFLRVLLRFVELDGDDCKREVDQKKCSYEDDHDEVESEEVVEGVLYVLHEEGPSLESRDDVDVQKSVHDVIEVGNVIVWVL